MEENSVGSTESPLPVRVKRERKGSTRFPEWLRKSLPAGASTVTAKTVRRHTLHTVCEEARCPNRTECWSRRAATFMLLGDVCTRNCHYCSIAHGKPLPVDENEPERVAEAAADLGLRHVVLTSVNRDDLPDGGSRIFRETIRALRSRLSSVTVEVLTPDFKGDFSAVDVVLEAEPDVYNHNIETVEGLFPKARPGGRYRRSLDLLAHLTRQKGRYLIKSGLMVGLGETEREIRVVIEDLAAAGCEILTIGQYLQPDRQSLAVERFVTPEEFGHYTRWAREAGISAVYAGPFVRSSYLAEDVLNRCLENRRAL